MHLFIVSLVTFPSFPYNGTLWNPPHIIDQSSLELLGSNRPFWTQATDTTANAEETGRGLPVNKLLGQCLSLQILVFSARATASEKYGALRGIEIIHQAIFL